LPTRVVGFGGGVGLKRGGRGDGQGGGWRFRIWEGDLPVPDQNRMIPLAREDIKVKKGNFFSVGQNVMAVFEIDRRGIYLFMYLRPR